MRYLVLALILCGALAVAGARVALAQAGGEVQLLVGFTAGTLSDSYARLLARHMGRHLPGRPRVSVRNVPGGAGRLLALQVAAGHVPGTPPSFAMINPAILLDGALGLPDSGVDLSRFKWIGSPAGDSTVVWAWAGRGPTEWRGLLRQELVVGGTRAGSPLVYTPKILNALLGTKFRLVSGYAGGSELDDRAGSGDASMGSPLKFLTGGSWFELNHAVESGEIDGFAGMSLRQLRRGTDWLVAHKAVPLLQLGTVRAEALRDVPLARDLVTEPDARDILDLVSLVPGLGRPFAAAPDTPDEDVAALRSAFQEALTDVALQFEALEGNLELAPIFADEIAAMVARAVALSAAHAAEIRQLVQ